jgi:Na+/proline symporter
MTPIQLNLILFIIIVVAFAAFGFSASRRQKSAKEYFHDDNLVKNTVSLTATNITLGTGLVYLVTGAQHNGLLMLLVPLAVWLGYYLMSAFLGKATNITTRTGKNYLHSIGEEIALATGKRSPFAPIVSGALVVIFVLVLAFEIFASAKVVAPFLFGSPTVEAEIVLSLAIFSITVIYTLLGGINAVFRVDFLQVPLVIIFLPVFVLTTIPDILQPSVVASKIVGTLKLDGIVITAVAIAVLNAIATQFYSILNWSAVSHVEVKNQQRLLKYVGAASALIITIFVISGILHPIDAGQQVWQDVAKGFSALSAQSTFQAFLFSAILMLGMASILLTTTDAIVISAIMFWYDNVAGGNSTSVEENPKELRKIRRIGAITFSLCFVLLMIINYWQPDPFYLLLSMAGGVVTFAPMFVTAGILSTKPKALSIFTPKVVYSYFALFLLAGVANTVMLILKSPMIGYLGVFAFTLSAIFSVFVFKKGIRAYSS